MSESKHTPGPWEFVPAGRWYIGSGCGVEARTPEGPGFPTPNATGYYAIACPPPHGRDKEVEQEANARLIAAAPDLLAVAKRIEAAMDFDASDHPLFHGLQKQLLDAIAKAEGQS